MKEEIDLLSNLNDKQREAVTSDSKRLLILAGAGSGKTKTLLQKLIYLMEVKQVSPTNILGITFTKNAANEMVDRLIISADTTKTYEGLLTNKKLSKKDIDYKRQEYSKNISLINSLTLKTFHSLCYTILRENGVSEFDNRFKILSDTINSDPDYAHLSAEETSSDILKGALIELCKEDRDYLLDLKRYVLDYLVDKIHVQKETGKTHEDGKFYTSLNGTRVRSKSELYIADWLFRHSIEFQYEKEVNFGKFTFQPDFYIPAADFYLEHLSDLSYPTADKEKEFKKANKTLVKTYETQANDSNLFNQALEKAVKNRLPAGYKYSENITYEEEFKNYQVQLEKFCSYAIRVIDMVKVENLDTNAVLENALQDQHERVRDFYKLVIPLIERYKKNCINRSYLDFNDLIIRTIDLFKNRTEIATFYRKKFKYILVDEFQDVNNLQVELIDLLLTDENQLFCVGDDWQSIYGFRGSNVDYIVNFANHFLNSQIIKLNLNYRSMEHIVGASNEVIRNNKFQLDKEVQSFKKSSSKVLVYAGNNEAENIEFVVKQVRILQEENDYTKEDILFLYRRTKMFKEYRKRLFGEGLYVSGKTIHASKGLEAKAVFILGLTDGPGGFPDVWLDDRIYQSIKESKRDLLMEEERRLFYVALTRAKDQLYLITERGNESSFINEIPDALMTKMHIPMASAIEEVLMCDNCQSQIEEHFKFCPNCSHAT